MFSPEGVRAVDARLEAAGLLDLAMEEAGRAVADTVHARFPTARVLLLAGGVALFGAHQGWYGAAGTDDVVYPKGVAEFVHDNEGWLWPVVAAVGIVIGLLFLRWLLVQPRTDTVRRLPADVEDEGAGSGRTTLLAAAVLAAAGTRTESRGCHVRTDHPDRDDAWQRASLAVALDEAGRPVVAAGALAGAA